MIMNLPKQAPRSALTVNSDNNCFASPAKDLPKKAPRSALTENSDKNCSAKLARSMLK